MTGCWVFRTSNAGVRSSPKWHMACQSSLGLTRRTPTPSDVKVCGWHLGLTNRLSRTLKGLRLVAGAVTSRRTVRLIGPPLGVDVARVRAATNQGGWSRHRSGKNALAQWERRWRRKQIQRDTVRNCESTIASLFVNDKVTTWRPGKLR